jgi:hypothetical protein
VATKADSIERRISMPDPEDAVLWMDRHFQQGGDNDLPAASKTNCPYATPRNALPWHGFQAIAKYSALSEI